MFDRFDSFEKQFRWEEDRWVFRFRQRGAPVEVDAVERDRLIARHKDRRKTATRLFIGAVFAAVVVMGPFMRLLPTWMMMAGYYGSAVIIGLMLSYWCDQAVTARLRRRTPVGERLGWLGQWKMRAEVTPWRQVALSGLSIAMIGLLVATPLEDWTPVSRLAVAVMVIVLAAMFLFFVAMKWATERERERSDDWREALDDARDMRVE